MRRVVYALVLVLILKFISIATSDSAFIANDQCKQSEVFVWQKNISISSDCDCPPNFVALISESGKPSFCVMITKPQIWSNICISSGSPDDYYEITVEERATLNLFLRKANVTEFWISVRRGSAFDPPQKLLPGSKWGAPLEFDDNYDLEVSKNGTGNCLKANITRNYSAASFENCSNLYPQLCIYKRSTMLRLYCSEDEYTTRYACFQKYCYKIEKTSSIRREWNLYDVNNHRKFQLYQNLANESPIRCASSIVQSNLTYRLQQEFLNEGQANDDLYYVAMRVGGTMLLTKEFDCAAYQFKRDAFETPDIKLNFDKIHKKLLLVIRNSRFLWRERAKDIGVSCFTDADTELLKEVNIKRKVWPPKANHGVDEQEIYEMKLYGDFPGNYWCEGHSVPNFTLVKSDRIIAQKKDFDVHIFSVRLEVFSLEYEKIWQKNNLKRLTKDYLEHLKSNDDEKIHRLTGLLKGMQVMKIENIDRSMNRISLIAHVSARYIDYVVDLEPVNSNYADNDEYTEKHYHLKQALKFLFESTCSRKYNFKGINSTDICLPQDTADGLKWRSARIGQTIAPQNLCLVEATGLPLTRKCVGDKTYGGVWQQLHGFFECSKVVNRHTMELFNYTETSMSVDEIVQLMGKIEHTIDSAIDIIPADLFYLSKTMDHMRSSLLNNGSNNVALIGNERTSYYCGVAGILNRVMYMNESVVLRSQIALNTTNILLDSTDDIINQLSASDNSDFLRGNSLNCLDGTGQILDVDGVLDKQHGTILFTTSRLILLVADPFISGISGIALTRTETNVDSESSDLNFDLFGTRLISADEDENAIMLEDNLDVAAYVPRQLLEKITLLKEQIDENITMNEQVFRIVISIYFNDNVFKETTNGTILKANSKVISVTIPGYSSDLPGLIPIFFRDHDANRTTSCGYWNFEPDDVDSMPKWSFGGCSLAQQNDQLTLCKCSHLTPFSRLCMDIQHIESNGISQTFIGEHTVVVLDTITAIGSALSLLGVIGIFVTAFMFPTWRSTANSKILLQLSLAIAIEMVIIFLDGPDINYNERSSKIQCTLLGGAFHYIILVTFMWMLAIAYLQFLRYVKVLGRMRPSRFILKASLLSWGAPLVPVILFATLDYTMYHKQNNNSDICYPHRSALYFGLLLPIGIVILVNMASFLVIIYNVFRAPGNLTRSSDRDLTLSQIRLSLFLFFLLGLPWIFGMMITIRAGNIFSYLFCLTAPLQGFILFVYFIIMDPIARNFWCLKCSKVEQSKNVIDMPVK